MVVVIDGELIVAAHGHAALVVGQLQVVVGVENVGEHRLGDIVNGVAAGKPLTELTVEELLRGLPVGLAVLQPIHVTVVFVGEVVEGNVYGAVVQFYDGHGHPLVVGYDLQRTHLVAEQFVALCVGVLCVQQAHQEYDCNSSYMNHGGKDRTNVITQKHEERCFRLNDVKW